MMVSVCMAVFNGEKYIREQINSILMQLNPNDELIVSDHGSLDNTLEVINTIQDKRIYIYNYQGKNIVGNFENALSKAKGDYIFLSDQDDIWHHNKVEECIMALKTNDLVFSNLEVFRDDISETRPFFTNNKTKTGLLRNIVKNNYIGATMAFKRTILDTALPFPKDIYMHDIWLAMVAEIKGRTFFINKPLVYYRRHGNNASQTGERSSNSILKKLSMRVILISNLIKRFS